MPKEDNLIPLTQRSPEEAAEIRRKGGKARQEQIKERATIRSVVEPIINGKIKGREIKALAKQLGLPSDCTLIEVIIKAVSFNTIKNGSYKDLLDLIKIMGQDNAPDETTIGKLDEVLKSLGGNI